MFQDLSFLDEVKICPHCQQTMSLCEAPPIHVGDGLGWGSDVLFICLNDSCPLFLKGWQQIENQYGHHASYRYMEVPGSPEGNCMMVGNADAFKACIVDREELKNQNARYRQEKEATQKLKSCIADHNLEPVMALLLNEGATRSVRDTAAGYLVELNDLACIDPLRNHTFRDTALEQKVNMAITELLKINFKKECPHCLEIIKAQAKKCMHCKEDL
ncbi:zinc ribbon domain-containing protein [Desulfopila sp. IMCC35006]|uniref:zinc ribbon domain-containing protein n=1 Tax=Desulfopila sp. IMCC35006 TaxID=2569542 RepID=UPI0010AD8F56|nr:zinc ribbon domain-containing protein [Desulfopila sp. IMCC35006]TKB27376.1 zinc ribbon domain-containing protein [Desulfopila sp. IMCC35006]